LLPKEVLENYTKAGKIAAETRRDVQAIIKAGVSILEICERAEDTIRRKGGEPAFPCNVCVNAITAHYSSPPKDTKAIPENSIVKLDLGVHVDGYIADTAVTVSLTPEFDGMVYAVNEALKQAVKAIRPGVRTDQIGKTVQDEIERYGFKPVWNLTGHQLGRYVLHTGKSIPSVPRFGLAKINVDEVFAVEPFLTLSSGGGEVFSSDDYCIFRLQKDKAAKSRSEEHTSELQSP
jgi:methionyl aminopeptidase